ncbi:endothelial cell-specific molecule 1-like [Argopecten irradians]|uniref:endothelial cell-specific molecule 1-like n=1 Tax=Argopecten irradians TaxID=31199 RepID=UPI0037174A87
MFVTWPMVSAQNVRLVSTVTIVTRTVRLTVKTMFCDMANGQCAECDIGFFGNHCDQTCPGNCQNLTCNKDSGLCIDCNDGYYGPTCTPCHTTCSTNTCDKTSGNCLGKYH